MFDFKITPGPWAFHLRRPYGHYAITSSGVERRWTPTTEDDEGPACLIANVLCTEATEEELVANTQAIVGLPDLIDAANDLLDFAMACQDGSQSWDDATGPMMGLRSALAGCGGVAPTNPGPTLFASVGDWKRVDSDGTVLLKVTGFPIPDNMGRLTELAGCTSESMWVEVISGDDHTGVGKIANHPISSRFILGQLITYGGGSDTMKPHYLGSAEHELEGAPNA